MTEPSRPVTLSAPDDGPAHPGPDAPGRTSADPADPARPADPADLVAELDELRQALLRERGRAEQAEQEARRARHREEVATTRLAAIEKSRAFLIGRRITRLGTRLPGRRR